MKILFMGSADFAVPSLKAIFDSEHDVAAVIAQPDKPAGRGRKITPCPVAREAKRLGLTLYQPESIRSGKVLEKIRGMHADMIVVVAYGKLLPNELLKMPKHGCINLHSSLLPKYRGAAPVNWAIVRGEKETGVTTMRISEKLDAGDILLQKKMKIEEVDTAITIVEKLSPIGAKLLVETIDGVANRTIKARPQNDGEATFAPIIKREDAKIDWRKPAKTIRNLVRGMQPWPIAYTHINGRVLKIFSADVLNSNVLERPGTIVAVQDDIVVATGKGKLCINELQIEGKRRMSTPDFLHGHRITVGTVME